MEEGAKRRLVGAAVMVALMVIFLPMLLEEETRSPVSDQEMTIPPRPDFDKDFDRPRHEGPIESPVSGFSEPGELAPRDSRPPLERPPTALFDAPATAEPELAPEPEPELETERETAAETATVLMERVPPPVEPAPSIDTAKAPEPERKPASTPAPASEDLSSWVIQVAAFREHKRAYSLVQDLRAKGFPAYIEEAEVKEQLWHRVRVGPEIDRRRIETMAASLESQTGADVRIQSYP